MCVKTAHAGVLTFQSVVFGRRWNENPLAQLNTRGQLDKTLPPAAW